MARTNCSAFNYGEDYNVCMLASRMESGEGGVMTDRPEVVVEACTANSVRIECAGYEIVILETDASTECFVRSHGQKVKVSQ